MVHVTEDVFATAAVDPFTKQTGPIRRFTLSNDEQMSVQILTLGATISSIKVPDAQGQVEDVTLGFDNLAGYQGENNPYMGATIGRVCNRIANGRFQLDGQAIEVSRNRGTFQLHGGFIGFDKAHWKVLNVLPNGVSMTHTNPDGHEGYPGEVQATVTFTLTEDQARIQGGVLGVQTPPRNSRKLNIHSKIEVTPEDILNEMAKTSRKIDILL